jgi:hypothetical protein
MSRYKNSKGLYISYNSLLLVSAIVILLIILYVAYQDLLYRIPQSVDKSPDINVQVISPVVGGGGGDDRFTRAPKPERDWITSPDLSSIRPSLRNLPTIPTRGIPESYQQMGILRTDSGSILPLYGRPTASRSDRFQYYSRTDSYNPIQLPLRYNNYNCVDDVGCNELFDGDTISLIPTGERAAVTLYRISGPTYVPVIT